MTDLLQALLTKRGILPTEWEAFLHPSFERDTHDPFLMRGMEVAVTRIIKAKEAGEKIVIFGDYDADGIPATAVLIRAFKEAGIEATPLIPTRAAGYGLQPAVVEEIIALKAQLLITVDNGTVAQTEIAALKVAGIETIVCDHHQPQDGHIATDALAILNPKQSDCQYPFKELCGCAIAWKLAVALYTRLEIKTDRLKWLLDLVALSTVADMVPLLGENRVLVVFGLKVLAQTRNAGLQALAGLAAVDLTKVTTSDIGYRLAPRLNAPSRMHEEVVDGSNVSLELLTTENSLAAQTAAEYLHDCNIRRQSLLETQLKEALAQAETFGDNRVLVVYDAQWSSGVIGLLAGRLLEKYHRPVIVLAGEEGQIKGSVRSIDGVDVGELLEAQSALLARFGGHAKAGGLTLLESNDVAVESFRQACNAWAQTQKLEIADMDARCQVEPDQEVPLSILTEDLYVELSQLAPYGIGFPEPVLASRCRIASARAVGSSGAHLSCFLSDGLVQKKAIGFGMGTQTISTEAEYNVVYTLQQEEWQGRVSLSCHLKRAQVA